MCPGDLTSASVLANITRPPKNNKKNIIIVMTSFLTNNARYNVYNIVHYIIKQ